MDFTVGSCSWNYSLTQKRVYLFCCGAQLIVCSQSECWAALRCSILWIISVLALHRFKSALYLTGLLRELWRWQLEFSTGNLYQSFVGKKSRLLIIRPVWVRSKESSQQKNSIRRINLLIMNLPMSLLKCWYRGWMVHKAPNKVWTVHN